jgi:hypothetical protein
MTFGQKDPNGIESASNPTAMRNFSTGVYISLIVAGFGAVLLSLGFTIVPAINMFSSGEAPLGALWLIWGIAWTIAWAMWPVKTSNQWHALRERHGWAHNDPE